MSFLINLSDVVSGFHKHDNYEIITVLNGVGYLKLSEQKIPITEGNIIVIPPRVTHSFESDGKIPRIYVNGKFPWHFNFSSPKVLTDNETREGNTIARLIYDNRFNSEEYLTSLVNAFMYFILQNLKIEDNIGLAVSRIMREIVSNFSDVNFSLNKLLLKSGYAEDYIRAHFKRITEKTPVSFLTDVRIKHARHLIDTYKGTVSLAEIAYLCGYADYAYFSRKFKTVIGVSPKDYEREFKRSK